MTPLNTLERARNRWQAILPQLGVETRYLTNKHGPCPICRRGVDRFRFDDKDGTGSFYCNQCGAGSGIILVRKLKGWTHKEACDEIDKILGDAPAVQQPQSACQTDDSGHRLRAIERALADANCPEVVDSYLRKRGLSVSSPVLRGDARCPYFDDRRLVGRYPALVAPIAGPDGSLQSVHRIYDADLDPRKKTMPPVRTISGAAVRLFECDEELGIGEGIENSLAAHELFGVPVWAALTANGIKSFEPPPGLLRLHIFADNDANFVGQSAAFQLGQRVNRDDLTVEVHVPPIADTDWLDVLNERGRP
jgi:putative DNA primase/helicase